MNKRLKQISLVSTLILVMFLSACNSNTTNGTVGGNSSPSATQAPINSPIPTATQQVPAPTEQPITATQPVAVVSGNLQVSFIDVGQADSILIKSNGASMLIDAGNNADGGAVVSYLKQQDITKLDYLIGTHPHEDHIGGMDDVIRSITIM